MEAVVKSKPVLLVAIIIGIVAFLAIRLTCDRRKPAPPPKPKAPMFETPPAQIVAGTYEMIGDDHMQVTMAIEPVSEDEARFSFSGVSSENRTVDMAGAAFVYHSLAWHDQEQNCSVYIDFQGKRATVHNECEDCCDSGAELDGDYGIRGSWDAVSLAGEYHRIIARGDDTLESVLRVTHASGNSYTFSIDAVDPETEAAGSVSGRGEAYLSMILRDEEEGCELAILFGEDTAAVSNTCEYCCQWRAYIDGDYARKTQ